MSITRRLLLAALPLAAASALPAQAQVQTQTQAQAQAQAAPASGIVIEKPWARAAIRGGTGGAFLAIRNTNSEPDRLVAVSSPLPRLTELHTTVREGDVMRMQAVQAVEIPPGGTVTLQPGGLHIMLVGLSAAMTVGSTLPLTLTFERAGAVALQVPVQAAGSTSATGHANH